eukprot:Rhum_TRINITY_DN12197_c0_g1::Rhum_TRINITY_DN12197_c0_g1_i2::g.49985::m.49985
MVNGEKRSREWSDDSRGDRRPARDASQPRTRATISQPAAKKVSKLTYDELVKEQKGRIDGVVRVLKGAGLYATPSLAVQTEGPARAAGPAADTEESLVEESSEGGDTRWSSSNYSTVEWTPTFAVDGRRIARFTGKCSEPPPAPFSLPATVEFTSFLPSGSIDRVKAVLDGVEPLELSLCAGTMKDVEAHLLKWSHEIPVLSCGDVSLVFERAESKFLVHAVSESDYANLLDKIPSAEKPVLLVVLENTVAKLRPKTAGWGTCNNGGEPLTGKYSGVFAGCAKGLPTFVRAVKRDFDLHLISTAETELTKEITRALRCLASLPLRACPKVGKGEYAKEVATRDLRGRDIYIVDSYPNTWPAEIAKHVVSGADLAVAREQLAALLAKKNVSTRPATDDSKPEEEEASGDEP